MEKKKMKAGVFALPQTTKGRIIAFLFLILILAGCFVPIINMVNKPILVLGMPLLMFWSILIELLVVVVLRIANSWEVF